MKQILIVLLSALCAVFAIKADEKRDSLNYYVQRLSVAYDSGNFQEASMYFKHTLRLYKEVAGDVSKNTEYASIANDYANLCYQMGDYETAVKVETEVSNIYQANGSNQSNCAMSLNNLAMYYSALGDYNEAIRLGTEAMEVSKRVLGSDHPNYAMSLNNLAGYYAYLGNYNEAIRLGTEAMEIRKRVLGDENPNYAMSLNNLAGYYAYLGNYNEAIRLTADAMEIYKKVLGTENPNYALSLNNLSLYYSYLGNYNEAIRVGTEAMEIRKRVLGDEHPDYAVSLNSIAAYYSSLGDYNEAVRLGTEAMEIDKRVLGTRHPNYALSLNNLALYYSYLGNYTEAIRLGTEAMEIRKKVLGAEHPDYAMSLNNLALYYSYLYKYKEATRLGTEAMEIYKRALGSENPNYAISIGNLAAYYSSLGNYNEAIRLGTEAMEIYKRVLGPEHPNFALLLNNLSLNYSSLGNYNEAIRLATEAMEVSKRALGSENLCYAVSLANLALYYADLGNYNKVIPLQKESISIIRNNVFSTFSGLTAEERLLYWDKYNHMLNSSTPNILISSGSPDVASVLYDNSALFAKGLLLSTELEMTKLIQESGDNEALQMYYELHQNRQILNAQYSKPIAERSIDCDSLERVSTNLERQLVSRVKEFGDYTRNLSITWRDVQRKLNDDDIAIEFLSYSDKDSEMHYVALTLCKNDTAPILTPLFVESKLLEASGDRETYQTAEADSLVWGPLASRLENKSHIYFSASGMLHNIGIEYFPSMDGKECYRLSSTRELVTHKPSRTMRGATLYGDIDYDATYASIESSTPAPIRDYAMNTTTSRHRGMSDHRSLNDGVDALPSTRFELNEVSALMKPLGVPCDTLMGVLASEESFKALSGQHKSLLHIATHGFYYNNEKANNLKPHLRQMLIGDERPSYAEDRSLLRCGLCFAGANQALLGKSQPAEWQGDGVLNALEIAQIDLRGLDLVVLSACQTALGDVAQGEGVFGLQRGFKKAGAQSILMSLWEVNDLTTQLLLTEFYKHYLSGQSKLESLKKAQDYVRSYEDKDGNKLFDDPYEWAGFILLDALD